MLRILERKHESQGVVTDIHCHALPGLDDGAADIDEALRILQLMVEAGFSTLFLSPHISASYPNTADSVREKLAELRAQAAREGIALRLEAHGEYMLDSGFAGLLGQPGELLCLPGGYLLVEVSMRQPNLSLQQTLFAIQDAGYKPILAHPERYAYYGEEELEGLQRSGCLFQINMLSLAGYYGSGVRRRAEWLIRRGACDLLGSDIHHARQASALISDRRLRRTLAGIAVKNEMFAGLTE